MQIQHIYRETPMIKSYGFSNFFSFRDQVEINFKVGKTAPDNNHFAPLDKTTRIAKVAAVFGANASGKTNLLKGLAFIKWFMLDSFKRLKPNEEILFYPFDFSEEKKKSTFFLEFLIENNLYKYEVVLTQERVYSEVLYHTPVNTKKTLFKRVFDENTEAYNFQSSLKKNETTSVFRIASENVSVFSVLLHSGHPVITKLAAYINTMCAIIWKDTNAFAS